VELETSNLILAQMPNDKSSLKGTWSGHVNHLHFGGANHISRTTEARVVMFSMHVG